jgi:hypothetical protein
MSVNQRIHLREHQTKALLSDTFIFSDELGRNQQGRDQA